MSLVRSILTVVKQGSTILFRATRAAGQQAYLNVTYDPQRADAARHLGQTSSRANTATDSSQAISQKLQMSYTEAADILRLSNESNPTSPSYTRTKLMEDLNARYEHLFKANDPTGEGKSAVYSHYLQSKVVRAKERILAELEQEREQVMH